MNDIPKFDLVVFGHITRDELTTSSLQSIRIGGVAYAASAAAKLGYNVGLLASLNHHNPKEVIEELTNRKVDCSGIETAKTESVVYKIRNADEVIEQRTVRLGPSAKDLPLPLSVPRQYSQTKAALIYPVDVEKALVIARALKSDNVKVAIDIQHDVYSLVDLERLSAECDFLFGNYQNFVELTGEQSIEEIVKSLNLVDGKVLIVKMGIRGSMVIVGEEILKVPSFQSNFKITVGAGDTYDAVFMTGIVNGLDLYASAERASLAAATVIESTNDNPADALADFSNTTFRQRIYISPQNASKTQIYIAGHFHSLPMREYINSVASALEHIGFKTFVPHRDVGVVGRFGLSPAEAYARDVEGLRNSQAVIAVLDNASRGGTFVEIGMAVERDIPVFALCTDDTVGISNMVLNSCRELHHSLKSLLNPIVAHFSE